MTQRLMLMMLNFPSLWGDICNCWFIVTISCRYIILMCEGKKMVEIPHQV